MVPDSGNAAGRSVPRPRLEVVGERPEWDFAPNETGRQWWKILGGTGVLLLRWIDAPQAILLATVAVLGALVLPPRRGRSLYRPQDQAIGVPIGLPIYAGTVLLLAVVFWSLGGMVHVMGAMWAMLAVGDGAATLVGRKFGEGRVLPWHDRKTWPGTIAYGAFGWVAASAATLWIAGRPDVILPGGEIQALTVCGIVAVLCAFLESLPVHRLDDNAWVPILGGIVMHTAYLLRVSYMEANLPGASYLVMAMAGHGVLAVLAWRRGFWGPAGAMVVYALGVGMIVLEGIGGYVVLGSAFLATHESTRHALRRRIGLGEVPEGARVRWSRHYLLSAFTMAVFMAFLGFSTDHHSQVPSIAGLSGLFATGLVGALCGTVAATLARELGPIYGRTPVLATTLRRVPVGTPGAISLEGSAVGFAGAIAIGLAGWIGAVVPFTVIPIVAVSGALASHGESFITASVDVRRRPGQKLLHFFNCGASALFSMLCLRLVLGS